MKWIYDVNRWYDKVEEPWRLIYMLVLMSPFFVGLGPYPLAALIYLGAVFFVRMYPRFVKE